MSKFTEGKWQLNESRGIIYAGAMMKKGGLTMSKCPIIDRVELTRRKFAKKPTRYKMSHVENLNRSKLTRLKDDDTWDGIHCPECGAVLQHTEGCMSCPNGDFF